MGSIHLFIHQMSTAFFNNCGESKDWIYPIKDIVISYKEDKCEFQDHLEFLRTDDGYKLISLTIRKGEIK